MHGFIYYSRTIIVVHIYIFFFVNLVDSTFHNCQSNRLMSLSLNWLKLFFWMLENVIFRCHDYKLNSENCMYNNWTNYPEQLNSKYSMDVYNYMNSIAKVLMVKNRVSLIDKNFFCKLKFNYTQCFSLSFWFTLFNDVIIFLLFW